MCKALLLLMTFFSHYAFANYGMDEEPCNPDETDCPSEHLGGVLFVLILIFFVFLAYKNKGFRHQLRGFLLLFGMLFGMAFIVNAMFGRGGVVGFVILFLLIGNKLMNWVVNYSFGGGEEKPGVATGRVALETTITTTHNNKKNLDNKSYGLVVNEIEMFVRWFDLNCHRRLLPNECVAIARGILARDNFQCGEDLIVLMGTSAATATSEELAKVDEIRRNTGFDNKIYEISKSIGFPVPRVMKKPVPTPTTIPTAKVVTGTTSPIKNENKFYGTWGSRSDCMSRIKKLEELGCTFVDSDITLPTGKVVHIYSSFDFDRALEELDEGSSRSKTAPLDIEQSRLKLMSEEQEHIKAVDAMKGREFYTCNKCNAVNEQYRPACFRCGEGRPTRLSNEQTITADQGEGEGEGDASSQYSLGVRYFFGIDVQKNCIEAVKLYRLAAGQGQVDAQLALGAMYEDGDGVIQDYEEAAKWYQLAADQGHLYAHFKLGDLYSRGLGVIQDYEEAAKWYQLAADQGQVDAHFKLGDLYKWGRGVTQNDAEAVKLYRLAADQGYASAQYQLGELYSRGLGVIQDYEEAIKWYQLAADQGDEYAQNALVRISQAVSCVKTNNGNG